MRLALVAQTGDGVMDGMVERVGIGKGAVGALMLFEIAQASLDIVKPRRRMLRQQFDGEPCEPGESAPRQAYCSRSARCEDRDQGQGSFGGAVCGAELVEHGYEVGEALGRAGVHEQTPWTFSPRA